MDPKGGKNNREMVERVGKRQRDHFRHKTQKKLRKKQKERTVQYI